MSFIEHEDEDFSITLRLPEPGEDISKYPAFDNTKLNAIATCPTDGLVRYEAHRIANEAGRSMALEAGAACHEVFAATRLLHLGREHELFMPTGQRLFGEARFKDMLAELDAAGSDERMMRLKFGLSALHSSGFFDDPNDKRRTMSNLEESCIAYIDRYPFEASEIARVTPTLVGIEIPFEIVCELDDRVDGSVLTLRLIGRLDGLHWLPKRNYFRIEENKTASRLNDAWSQSFRISHQITIYMVAASLLLNTHVSHGLVHGLSVPMPKTYDYGGIVTEEVTRSPHQFKRWMRWLVHIVRIWDQYRSDILRAPQYAHSCNRYFRPCQFIDFCEADQEERDEMLASFPIKEWSPLHELESKTGD